MFGLRKSLKNDLKGWVATPIMAAKEYAIRPWKGAVQVVKSLP
jgi:hypothetical protein